jgi:hypothetical protein
MYYFMMNSGDPENIKEMFQNLLARILGELDLHLVVLFSNPNVSMGSKHEITKCIAKMSRISQSMHKQHFVAFVGLVTRLDLDQRTLADMLIVLANSCEHGGGTWSTLLVDSGVLQVSVSHSLDPNSSPGVITAALRLTPY